MREYWFAYLLFLPTLFFLLILLWIPLIRGIFMSFYEWPLVGSAEFVGLANYQYLLTWNGFYTSLKATAVYSIATVIQLLIAILAAYLVVHQKRFQNIVSGVFLTPYSLPPVVTGAMWMFMLDPSFGIISKILLDLNLIEQPLYWQSNGEIALTVITGVAAWTFWPLMFLIILASWESIPDYYYEAAEIYGASRLQKFFRVTLPQLKSAILVAVSIRFVWNLAKISQPLQMTGGGPGFDTSVLSILLFRFAFNRSDFGLAFAAGIFLLIITSGFMFLFIREYEQSREAHQ
jgi:ABC-type sugar transport system permease subunit